MLNYKKFIEHEKSMLIAPAGFGKSYTIAESLKHTESHGKQLILTHTHAGVASIKQKIISHGIKSSTYSVETISSFAQKYVLSFYTGNDIPDQDDSKNYYPFIIDKAISLLKLNPIKNVVASSYSGLFVDEYQDCNIKQHELVLLLADFLPTRILGDFLQGIFNFGGVDLVNMNNPEQMGEFANSTYNLTQPQRWLNGNNLALGQDLLNIRNLLINNLPIDLLQFKSIEFRLISNSQELINYNFMIKLLSDEKSLLIIDPNSVNATSRIKFIQRYKNIPRMIESIDDKLFYNLSKELDKINNTNVVTQIIIISIALFNKTGIDNWFNSKGLKNKVKSEDKVLSNSILNKVKCFETQNSYITISTILKEISTLPEVKCYRKELFLTLWKALEDAEYNNITVYEAMVQRRNLIRRSGRKIFGKCIGTTLLTKGLEFDTVVLINAHNFKCPKNLYVAMTRASKKLIIFSESQILNPY